MTTFVKRKKIATSKCVKKSYLNKDKVVVVVVSIVVHTQLYRSGTISSTA